VLGESPLSPRIGAGGRALSRGQLRRLSIAQILLGRPDVLLADEPTEGLDAPSARELLLALRLANPSMTMVLALHEQQAGQLSWAPDTLVRLRLDRPTAAVSGSTTVAGPHGADGRGERS
jgi:ATP-binding cassette subfamily C protein CydC